VTEVAELLEAANWWGVVENLGVVGVLAPKDRGTGWATQRLGGEGVREREALCREQCLEARHDAKSLDVLIVGQYEENVWPGGWC
jgi:hypothetical protein